MQFRTELGPAYSLCVCDLQPGEQVMAESGAMVTQDVHIQMQTSATQGKGVGGFLKALGRSMFMGESFFRKTFSATQAAGVE